MAGFRRPELEKDNPIAPQPYVGPRRRLAMTRAAALGEPVEISDIQDTLHRLTEAASRYLAASPKGKPADQRYKALCDAIVQAKRVLATEGRLTVSGRKKL